METYADDPHELKDIPTGMETDPEADEQVINQTTDGLTNDQPAEVNPSGIEKPKAGEETPADDLANALAHAIDGSGIGLAGAPPVAPSAGDPQSVINEGTTGAGEDVE